MPPYIITIASPPPPPNYSRSGNIITNKAVSTIEQARETVPIRWNVPESGGRITLDDNTEIEVVLANDATLRAACPLIFTSVWLRMSLHERIDAYNATQTC